MKSFIFIFLTLSITNIYAQVPNQFNSGDPVSAEKINENFTFASKRLVLKNNNSVVGDIHCDDSSCIVITVKGYIVPYLINVFLNTVKFNKDSIYYLREDNSWTGGSCPNFTKKVRKRNFFLNSIVIGNDNNIHVYNKDTSSTNGITNYIYVTDGSSCSGGYGQTSYDLVSVTDNDENITGFPNTIGTLTVAYE